MQKLAVEGTVRWRCAVLVALKNWMLKFRGSFESFVIQDLPSAGSSELDMLSKYTSPRRCLARGSDATTAWQESPKFLPAYDRVIGTPAQKQKFFRKSKHHVLTSEHHLIHSFRS